MSSKLLKFPQEIVPFYEFLDDLKKAYDENRLNNLVFICESDYENGEEKKAL